MPPSSYAPPDFSNGHSSSGSPPPTSSQGALVRVSSPESPLSLAVETPDAVGQASEQPEKTSHWVQTGKRHLFSWLLLVAGFGFSAPVLMGLKGGGSASVGLWIALMGVSGALATLGSLVRAGNKWSGRLRFGWGCVALAGAAFGLDCLAGRSGSGAHPSLLHANLWAGQLVLLTAGLLALAWRGGRLALARLLGDTSIVALAGTILFWPLTFASSPHVAGAPVLRALRVGEPFWELAGAFIALILLSEASKREGMKRAAQILAVAALCWAIAHRFAPTSGRGFLSPWAALACGWAFVGFGVAALGCPREHAIETSDEPAPSQPKTARSLLWTPLEKVAWALPLTLTIGVAVSILARHAPVWSGKDGNLWPLSLLLWALGTRQMIALWDNSQMLRSLRASSANMERNVGERTHHIATLLGITSTLNTSLDRRTVLRFTLEKTIAVTGADAGGIWLREPRGDIYEGDTPQWEWKLMHWQGEGDPSTPSLLRDLAIAEASEGDGADGEGAGLSPGLREAVHRGLVPARSRMILVPVKSQGLLLGTMGLMRENGSFSYDDRALVESVALEAGTALQNARMYSEAAHRADRDSVTDLFNHRAVQEKMTETYVRCKRTGEGFSIIMMDLNNFKFFNDTYGHPVGDEVLRTVARGLREACRGSDVLGRYGGDEFIVVLPDTDAAGTLDVCARIKATLDSKHFEPVPGTCLPIGTAFGWASFPQDGDSIIDLLSAADANLYNHKRGGASYLSQSQKALQTDRDEVKKLKNRAHGGSFGVLDALVTAIDNKDHYTRHHSEEVTFLSLLVARELGYSPEQLEAVRISGLLHDVGKIAVPDSILRHPGKLGRDEWDIMQQHPVFGALIVKDVPHLERVVDGIKHHHEKWDGSGYPEKFAGEDIPEMGRLLAMGDTYSALTTDRPYRKGWKPEAALEEIERCAGAHFDPRLCAVFLEVMRRELELGGDTSDYGARIAQDFLSPVAEAAAT